MSVIEKQEQYVCKVCGYNMVGFHPDSCPFCGANQKNFITAAECSQQFEVKHYPVTDNVTRLNSYPELGYEHAAYKIETDDSIIWVDCPSTFDTNVERMDIITFTHHHFLGASNLYRKHFSCEVQIHRADSDNRLSSPFTFDKTFDSDFTVHTIEVVHIDGHTPGFTVYFFERVAFICDYVFYKDIETKFNPYGNTKATIAGGKQLEQLLLNKEIETICAQNYTADFDPWYKEFKKVLAQYQ